MASVNKVILLGRLGRDPETRSTNSGSVTTIALATTRSWKTPSGERKEETDWHNVVFFGRSAETVAQYVTKGQELYIEGRNHTSKYIGKDGVERWRTDVIAETFQFGAKAQSSGGAGGARQQNQQKAGDSEDDIPF